MTVSGFSLTKTKTPYLIVLVPLLFLALLSVAVTPLSVSAAEPAGLVGRWDFDDGTGKDLSGNGANAVLGGATIYPLGGGHACIKIMPDAEPLKISVPANSPLAVPRGTFCLWLNTGRMGTSVCALEYGNKAVQLMVYRRHFQARFRGKKEFKFGKGILGGDWPDFLLREDAFYPHEKAVTGEGEWHHFAVAYDDRAKKIVGWRDGEIISTVDLSTVAMEPLARENLRDISTGPSFNGFIGDLRVYSQVLSDADVQSIFKASRSIYEGRNDAVAGDKKMSIYEYREQDRTLYRAWLQYGAPAQSKGKEILSRIVVEGSNPTVKTAGDELAEAMKAMFGASAILARHETGAKVVLGTPESSEWVRGKAAELGLDRIERDGYVIKALKDSGATTIVVAAREAGGVVFGVFDLIRRIQTGQNLDKLDALENPKMPVRMVNHWSTFRGFPHDDWYGKEGDPEDGVDGRLASIYSWEDLRKGNTARIRDWARLLASAGWNAVCPTDVNWEFRNNYLEHLNELKTLAGIFRNYGIKLYWAPNYLLALKKETADTLYAAIPDFGGYLLKLGSEAQNGDPRPVMVNKIADTLKSHGGYAIVRGFVYGKYRYSSDDMRDLNPYNIIAPEDGKYRDNVVLLSKGSPLDWDFSAPIPALDGAIKKNLYGGELVIDKDWPVSWVGKWKWWLEQDNYRKGPGSLNKFDASCILGVSMISPSPAWTVCPLNMVNYYGLGRLAWNPDLSLDEIYTDWARLTFGNDPDVIRTVKTLHQMSGDTTRKLYLYRGYRGIWIDSKNMKTLTQAKTPHTIGAKGIGTASPELRKRVLDQYAPGFREIYGDPVRGEEFFATFNFESLDYKLSTGRTVIQDVYANLDEAVQMAKQMPELWSSLKGKVDQRRFQYTLDSLNGFMRIVNKQYKEMVDGFGKVTGRNHDEVMASLAPASAAAARLFNVRDYGAKADGNANDAKAINQAIDACSAAGGGTVLLPSGVYASGSIQMKNNVTLALDAGAVLKALAGAMNPWEPNPNDKGLMDAAYYHWQASLIWGENLENVKIVGPGTLVGIALTRSSKVPAGTGDKGIALKQCKQIEIRNLKIEQGGHYAILMTGCEDALVDNVTINTGRDGLDLMQCRNVTVSDCHINAVRYEDGRPAGGDDAIKLGSDLSLGQAQASENITVRNCMLASGCNTIQFGSETVGNFKNIRFENIRILSAGKAGIGISSNDGAEIENISSKNISMKGTFAPIFIKIADVARVTEGTFKRGTIRNLIFENITADDCYSSTRKRELCSLIWGKPGSPIENVEFKNVRIVAAGGHPASEASRNPEENDVRFPTDLEALPAYSWYLRHVNNVRFVDCDFGFASNDARPAFVVDDGEKVVLEGCDLMKASGVESAVAVRTGPQVNILPGKPREKRAIGNPIAPVMAKPPPQSAAEKKGKKPPKEGTPSDTAPLPEGATLYEAEDAAPGGGVLAASKRGGFTGKGYMDFKNNSGDYIEWTVDAKTPGKHRLIFRYSLRKEMRPLELKVGETVVQPSLEFPSTGDWIIWKTVETEATLETGANKIRISSIGKNGPCVDSLAVSDPANK